MFLLRLLGALLCVCGAIVDAQTSEPTEIVYNFLEELPYCAQQCIGYADVSAAFPGGCGASPAHACDCNLGAWDSLLFDCFMTDDETRGMALEGCHGQNIGSLVTFITNVFCRRSN
jgi:hypothetical protein